MNAARTLSFPSRILLALRRLAPWLRPRALGTIRGRLALGFGATVVLVAMIAGLAVSALSAGNTGNAEALSSVEQEFEGAQR